MLANKHPANIIAIKFATGQREGMMVMEQSLGQLVQAGVITYEEAVLASVHPEEIAGLSATGATGTRIKVEQ